MTWKARLASMTTGGLLAIGGGAMAAAPAAAPPNQVKVVYTEGDRWVQPGDVIADGAVCPAGYVVVSGGHRGWGTAPEYSAPHSEPGQPADKPNAWSVQVRNYSNTSHTLDVWAMCLRTG